jgi:predicted PurR-regulated permease PerM
MGLILGLGGLALVNMLAVPLAMLFLAITIGSALLPLVDWIHRRGVPRPLAVVIIYALLLLFIASLFAWMIPVLVEQARALLEQSDVLLPRVTGWIEELGFSQSDLISAISSQLGQATTYLFSVPLAVATRITEFILVIFTSLFWVMSAPAARGFALSFFPAGDQPRVAHVLEEVGRALGGYVRGAAINGLLVGTAMYIGLSVIGVPYAAFLAILAGLLEFFPVVGPVISVGLSVVVALTVAPATALITLAYGLVVQQVESNILTPLVMRAQAKITALLSIFAVVAGASIGGLLGALVALPLAAALQVLVQLVVAPALRRANGVGPEDNA